MAGNAIFITCYNCEKQLPRVIDNLVNCSHSLIQLGWAIVYMIDNKSDDNTAGAMSASKEKLENARFNAFIISNNQNYGLGGSHKVAFDITKQAKYSYCCILHGDDQADPHDLLKIGHEFSFYDAYLGSRFSRRSRLAGYSAIRVAGNIAINAVYSVILMRFVKDLGSGLNIYSQKVVNDAKIMSMPDSIYFNTSLLMLIIKYYKYEYFPIAWSESDQVSNARILQVGIQILLNLFCTAALDRAYIDSRSKSKSTYEYKVY